MITSALALLPALLAVTAVHELGHLAAAIARRARVTRVIIGRGPRLAAFRRGGIEFGLALLPFGGRVDYVPPASSTANAVIAVGGAVANIAFGFAMLWAAALAFGVEAMPFGMDSASPLAYATDSTGAWLWAFPLAVVESVLYGDGAAIAAVTDALRGLWLAPGAPAALHAVAALSITWAALNMLPVPGLATDGWQFLVWVRRAFGRAVAEAAPGETGAPTDAA
ncbi:MAG TPA: site-2 protease family protein [Longimicrobiales bacterium]